MLSAGSTLYLYQSLHVINIPEQVRAGVSRLLSDRDASGSTPEQ